MDRGAWQAAVREVTQSPTRLKRLSTYTHTPQGPDGRSTETPNPGSQYVIRPPSWPLCSPQTSGTPEGLVTDLKRHRSPVPLLRGHPALDHILPGVWWAAFSCSTFVFLVCSSLLGLVCVRKPLSLFPVSLSFPPIAILHRGTEGHCFPF